jgi:hypothetical protein
LQAIDTTIETVAIVPATAAFLALVGGFIAHLRMSESKRRAKQKLDALERQALEGDRKAEEATAGGGKHRKREIQWERTN